MYPYPTSFPADEARLVAGMLRGTFPLFADGNHAAWSLYGYGSAQVVPGAGNVAAMAVPDKEQVAVKLTELADGKIGTLAMFPWEALLPLVLSLIQQLIERRRMSVG